MSHASRLLGSTNYFTPHVVTRDRQSCVAECNSSKVELDRLRKRSCAPTFEVGPQTSAGRVVDVRKTYLNASDNERASGDGGEDERRPAVTFKAPLSFRQHYAP